MEIVVAKHAGFCMGVKKAMDIALNAITYARKPIYTLGQLIHNPSALKLLESKGIYAINQIPDKGEGSIIIRAHGVPPKIKEKIIYSGFDLIDATCSKVIKVQMLVRHYSRKGYYCLVVGDEGHPEVIGIIGHGNHKTLLIRNLSDIENLPHLDNYIIVAQTTQDIEKYRGISNIIKSKFPNGRIFNTICSSTYERQKEAKELAYKHEAIIVIGGKNSANTRRLAEIIIELGKKVYFVEDETELPLEELKKHKSIAITAGASTPDWTIENVKKILIQNTN